MSSNRIHIAIPNSIAMLCDDSINLDSLHVGYIEGLYNEIIRHDKLEPTKFGSQFNEERVGKFVKFGKLKKPYLSFNETITIRELYESEGNFTITRLMVEFMYHDKVVYNGVPQDVQRVVLHHFKKWNFSPTFLAKIFDRVPSHPLYNLIKKERDNFLKRTGDKEAFKRLRSTWLVNKPNENEAIPYNVYKLWYGRGALIIPESIGDFKGRELGRGIKP